MALVGAGAAWPFTVRAQQATVPVIGYLNTGSREQSTRLLQAFLGGLKEAGFADGQNVLVEYRWAQDERDRLRALAEALVARQVNVIAATGGSPSAIAAQSATATIPIVFAIGADPVSLGLVSSLNQPGGNITGATMLAVDLTSKRLELLCEAAPSARTVAALINPSSPGAARVVSDMEAAAQAIQRQLRIIHATSGADFERAFSTLRGLHADALVIGADPLFNNQAGYLGTLTLRHAVPAVYQFYEFAAAGGLMSYGGSIAETYRQAGLSTGRILKGERPADLPVQQVTRFELLINLKTAAVLGLDIPPTLLARADELIE